MQNIINIKNLKLYIGLVALLGFAQVAFVSAARADEGLRAPELPPACSNLQPPAGNRLYFRTYAIGVQVYRWNGSTWSFVAPIANLYADKDFHGQIGSHYAGPTWESWGSKVVARRYDGCDLDPANAIPWLLLEKVSTEGFGIFKKVTYIQRLNTAGGVAPIMPGTTVGEEKRVPYSAEYYFYRGSN